MANAIFERLLFNSIKYGQQPVRSVYDIWLDLGNTGTPQDFLDTLRGQGAVLISNVTIPSSSWELSNGNYKATIINENITAKDVVNVNFTSSINDAISNGVLGYTNTIDGGFEIYSNFLPTVDLVIDYSIVSNG